MTDNTPAKLNDQVLARLNKAIRSSNSLQDAMDDWTRETMWRLRHIPARYFIMAELRQHLDKLANELARNGYIDLDADGQPACISGKPAVLQPAEKC